MMGWLRETINNSQTGLASSKRLSLLVATGAMSVTAILLGVAALMGYSVGVELGAVCVPLAGLSGYGYVNGKQMEERKP